MRHTRWWAAPAAMVSIALPCLSLAATFNVPADFASIQACIDAAISGVDECVVAPGTYYEKIRFLGKAIAVRSSSGADVTTINATGLGGSAVRCVDGEGPDTVLDGFTIIGGTGTLVGGKTYGGGMYISNSGPTVTHCVFTGNTAVHGGGGMSNRNSNPVVARCTFKENTCTLSDNIANFGGGGMYNENSTPTVISCTFSSNTARLSGGGMYNTSYSSPTVTACTFRGNMGTDGGGMYNYYSSPTVTNCDFSENTATGGGGGVGNFDSSPTVSHSTFSGNTAKLGGGMNTYRGNPTVTHCTFSGNMASATTQPHQGGGGMYNRNTDATVVNCTFRENSATRGGGGMSNYDSRPQVTYCTFLGNQAEDGGGMYNYGEYNVIAPTVTNCTFTGNAAVDGAGMFNSGSNPQVGNCTFGGNIAAHLGGGIYNYYVFPRLAVSQCNLASDTPDEIASVRPNDEPTIRFSNVWGGLPVGSIDGGGNIDVDPMFVRLPSPGPDGTWDGVDDDYGDLRLRAGSPCIDAGDPAFVAQPGETDLDGHARVLCRQVDMGAYEFGIGDYDCDLTIDLTDFSNWSSCMTGPQSGPYNVGCEAFDFDGDDDVDFLDFAAFQRIIGP